MYQNQTVEKDVNRYNVKPLYNANMLGFIGFTSNKVGGEWYRSVNAGTSVQFRTPPRIK